MHRIVENFLKSLNEFTKQQNYVIVISYSKKSFQKVKIEIFIRCIKRKKSRFSKFIDEKLKFEFKRINYSFEIIKRFTNNDNNY